MPVQQLHQRVFSLHLVDARLSCQVSTDAEKKIPCALQYRAGRAHQVLCLLHAVVRKASFPVPTQMSLVAALQCQIPPLPK